MHPQDERILLKIASMAEEAGEYPIAAEALERLFELRPKDLRLLEELADVSAWQKKHIRASELYGRVLEKEPENDDVRLKRAKAFQWAERYKDSVTELRIILSKRPEDPAVLLELGFDTERILNSLEMKMACGIGKCGRCGIGNKYICKDGPVFSYKELLELTKGCN